MEVLEQTRRPGNVLDDVGVLVHDRLNGVCGKIVKLHTI
jgi:hypothetical protein